MINPEIIEGFLGIYMNPRDSVVASYCLIFEEEGLSEQEVCDAIQFWLKDSSLATICFKPHDILKIARKNRRKALPVPSLCSRCSTSRVSHTINDGLCIHCRKANETMAEYMQSEHWKKAKDIPPEKRAMFLKNSLQGIVSRMRPDAKRWLAEHTGETHDS
jgi:hypothetical protein